MSYTNTYIAPSEVIADLLPIVDDVSRHWRSEGFYMTYIKYFLEEIGFDTLFDTQERDLEIPSNRRIPIPTGLFDIKEMYAFSGECTATNRQRVYTKRGYTFDGKNNFSPEMDTMYNDPFSDVQTGREGSALYCNVQNGMIMLSPACGYFDKIKVLFSGTFGEIDGVPFIPHFFRKACLDWCAKEILRQRMAEDPKFERMYAINNAESMTPFTGSFDRAKARVVRMSPKQREDWKQYFATTEIR